MDYVTFAANLYHFDKYKSKMKFYLPRKQRNHKKKGIQRYLSVFSLTITNSRLNYHKLRASPSTKTLK